MSPRAHRGPDFVGIGAQKAGTSWLHAMLREHPEIVFPRRKELHFWDRHYERGVDWYASLFDANDERLRGDITPAYAILPIERIREAAELHPRLRILYVLRNPTDRAWSHARMRMRRTGRTRDSVTDDFFIEHFHSEASLRRGDYVSSLRAWHTVFHREHVLLLRYEQLRDDPRGFLRSVCRHIGADPHFVATLTDESLQSRVFAGVPSPLPKQLRDVLLRIYEPKIRELERYLGWDLSEWLRDDELA